MDSGDSYPEVVRGSRGKNKKRDSNRGPKKGREGAVEKFSGSKRGRERDLNSFEGLNKRRNTDPADALSNKQVGDQEGAKNGSVQGKSSKSSRRKKKRKELLEEDINVAGSNEDAKSVAIVGINDELVVEKATSAITFGTEKVVEADKPRSEHVKTSDSYLSKTRFDQYPLSPLTLKAVKDVGFQTLTIVQEATLPFTLKGKDVLAKAKTGTGKTLAFLLPSIEAIVKSPPARQNDGFSPIIVLVICPTRELANQAAAEANSLLKYHSSIGVQVVIGGTKLPTEQKRLKKKPCQILVATPGRLKDHIENSNGFATRLKSVKVLVLDEADRLLDMGFLRDIERIIAAVPKHRQTFLFSATVSEAVRKISRVALKQDHQFINCVHEGDGDTHQKVNQMHMIAPMDTHFSLLYVLLKEHIANNVDYKVIVFCVTARATRLLAELLGKLSLNVREIHSRKQQSYRTKISDEFRKSKRLILVTSDVSARGVDYPDVSLVIQVGLPSNREQYIHRLGRTGRKGKEGEGILLLAPWEEHFLSFVKDLPIPKSPQPSINPESVKKVQKALSQLDMNTKESTYQAWLGYYNTQKLVRVSKPKLVELANEFSSSMGLDIPPIIPSRTLGKMNLHGIPGIRTD